AAGTLSFIKLVLQPGKKDSGKRNSRKQLRCVKSKITFIIHGSRYIKLYQACTTTWKKRFRQTELPQATEMCEI
ncbi:hypothetical protein, partial [Chryseobacterium sp. CH1]|uniref:hypothetical protein n=1 Tax=Chryseobacterium sp. CH1 TaxID=713551 RepID=UPI001E3DAC8E